MVSDQACTMAERHGEPVHNETSTKWTEVQNKEHSSPIRILDVPFQYDEASNTWKWVPSQTKIPNSFYRKLNENKHEGKIDKECPRILLPRAIVNKEGNGAIAKVVQEVKFSDIELNEVIQEENVEKKEEKAKKKRKSVFRQIKDKLTFKSKKEETSGVSHIQKLLGRLKFGKKTNENLRTEVEEKLCNESISKRKVKGKRN
ncbi:hypothetical protein QYM36_003836 [Artemia franciscana]|uniref:Uncharacterized protein n=1 Tax=Artemia franciscana TaxID=6661 RepID=A0AA88LHA6_ARTSF|nr:hypothetical protein QYM36_003836 [Artemia franciscana]